LQRDIHFKPKIDMETKVKRTREEAIEAFKDFMRRKKERQTQARIELEMLSKQGFFDN
jgi:hypothetical protein